MKTWYLIAGAVAVSGVAITGYGWLAPGVPVEAARARTGEIRQYVDERGVTRLPQEHLITMPYDGVIEPVETIEIDGRMARLVEGTPVHQGDVLARIAPQDVQLSVEAAEAAVERLDASIAENDDASVEQTGLKQAASFVTSMDHTVQAALNRVTAGKAKLEFAEAHLARLADLARRGMGNVTANELDRAKLSRIESDVDLLQDRLVHAAMVAMQAGTRLMPTAVQQYIDRKQLRSDVLKQERREARARLDQALRDQQRATMRSPVDGVVLERPVTNTRQLAAGTLLLKIGRLEDLEIQAEVLSQDVIHVNEGDAAEVYGPAIGAQPARATVHRVYPAGFTKTSSLGVEQQRVNVVLRFHPDDLPRLLASGNGRRRLGVDYRVRVRIFTDQASGAVVIPRSAVFRSATGQWRVFVVRGRAAHLQTISVGLMNDQSVQVTEGLAADDIVVLAPESNLTDGTRVKAILRE